MSNESQKLKNEVLERLLQYKEAQVHALELQKQVRLCFSVAILPLVARQCGGLTRGCRGEHTMRLQRRLGNCGANSRCSQLPTHAHTLAPANPFEKHSNHIRHPFEQHRTPKTPTAVCCLLRTNHL